MVFNEIEEVKAIAESISFKVKEAKKKKKKTKKQPQPTDEILKEIYRMRKTSPYDDYTKLV
jgi:hypothetical protein